MEDPAGALLKVNKMYLQDIEQYKRNRFAPDLRHIDCPFTATQNNRVLRKSTRLMRDGQINRVKPGCPHSWVGFVSTGDAAAARTRRAPDHLLFPAGHAAAAAAAYKG